MSIDIHIPPEAVEAARKAMMDCGIWAHPEEITAAIRAALAAWPGVKTKLANSINVEPREQYLILPIQQEPRDE